MHLLVVFHVSAISSDSCKKKSNKCLVFISFSGFSVKVCCKYGIYLTKFSCCNMVVISVQSLYTVKYSTDELQNNSRI